MSYLNNSQTLKAIDNTVSTLNSSVAPLGANAVFTGAWESTIGFASIEVLLRTDQPHTFYSEFSMDGIDVDRFFPTVIPSPNPASGTKFTIGVTAAFFRIRVVNGAAPQTLFRLQTIFSPVVTEAGAGPLFLGMGMNTSTQAHRSASFGQKIDGTYTPIQLDADGLTRIVGAVSVSNFPATQPVSVVSLPLPSGAATSANQSTGNTSLASVDSKLSSVITNQGTEHSDLTALINRVAGWPNMLPNSYVPVQSLVTGINLPSAGISYLLAAVRKKTGVGNFVRVKGYEGAIKTNDFIKFALVLNPTIAGSLTFVDVLTSPFQSVVGVLTNLVTGGREIDCTYASLNMQNYKSVENGLAQLGATDVIALVGTPALGSASVNVTAYMNVEWV